MISAPVSPLGQKPGFSTKNATCVQLATTQPVHWDRNKSDLMRVVNQEQPMHDIYKYAFITDSEEGLILTDVGTLNDAGPSNNFFNRALTWNEGGVLKGARLLTIAGTNFYPKGSDKPAPLPSVNVQARAGGDIFGNFIACVRSRKTDELFADILEGHYSSALCHLANVSYRLGTNVELKAGDKPFAASTMDAQETLARMQEHLGAGNGIKLDGLTYRLGRKLDFDPATEKFMDADANKLLTRDYRKPFAVPEKVS